MDMSYRFFRIMQECRQKLVKDVLSEETELYGVLIEAKPGIRYELQQKRYYLCWIISHWEKCKEILKKDDIPIAIRKDLLKFLLGCYQKFITRWGYTLSDALLFQINVDAIDTLILTEEKLQMEVNRLHNSFKREAKLLDNKIEEAGESWA